MNKAIKGAIAAGVAGIVMLGGYGTYALWNDTASLDGGAVNSGELALTPTTPADGAWTDVTAGGAGTPIVDIATFEIVPGDILTYTTSATITATGDNLEATLTADPTSVTGDPELLADVDVSTEVLVAGAAVPTISEANNGQLAAVTVTFDFDALSVNETQLQDLDLSGLQLVLLQV